MLTYREKLTALLADVAPSVLDLGGAGSGNFGHAGRPGEVGGSSAATDSGGDSGHDDFAPISSAREVPNRPDLGTDRPTPILAKDLGHAVDLILKGEIVELKDVGTVHTVLEKLAGMARDAEAKGEKAPDYDLCKVSVAGSNLFCGSSLKTKRWPDGIPRIEMPQLSGKPVPGTRAAELPRDEKGSVDAAAAFRAHLAAKGITATEDRVPASLLKASQAELIGPTVAGMMLNAKFDPGKEPIFVSSDNYVLDGHHRWAAVVGRDAQDGRLGESKINIVRVDAPISELLHRAKQFAARYGIAPKAAGKKTMLAALFDGDIVITFDQALAMWVDNHYDLTGVDLYDEELSLGDFPGHPFRGNQWADGGGRLERAPDSGSGGGPSGGMVIQSKVGPIEMRPATAEDADRLKALKVPPGWHDVHVSVDPTAAVQAVGKDDADRTVYKRSAAYDTKNAAQKFARGKEFNKAVPQLREQIGRDMTDAKLPEKERESALMLHIIDKTAFRPGSESDTGADKQAYGITTLEGRHVKVDGDKVRFRFRGKDGVLNAKTITDPVLARALEPRLATTGPKDQLFPTASDNDMRDYLHSRDGDFKPKDFRTWHGTTKAMEVMEKMPVPKTEKEFKKAQLVVSKAVAAHLGNTPAVARSSYIDPSVWSPWQIKKKAA